MTSLSPRVLPSGDAALTRRAKRASGLSVVVVRFSRARRRYERQGILVEEEAHQRLRVRFPLLLGRESARASFSARNLRTQASAPAASSGWSLSRHAGSLPAGALPSRNCSSF